MFHVDQLLHHIAKDKRHTGEDNSGVNSDATMRLQVLRKLVSTPDRCRYTCDKHLAKEVLPGRHIFEDS